MYNHVLCMHVYFYDGLCQFADVRVINCEQVSVLGTLLMTSLLIVCGVMLGSSLSVSWRESVFVSACLSLSSTPLVVKFLSPSVETAQANDGTH